MLRTKDDNWQGQPYGGVGLWWIPADLAKISNFLNADNGAITGQQILHPVVLAAALQHDPDDRGVDRGRYGKYNNAFWADSYKAGYDCEFWVPQMLGYSGIVVALMPSMMAKLSRVEQQDVLTEPPITMPAMGEISPGMQLCGNPTRFRHSVHR